MTIQTAPELPGRFCPKTMPMFRFGMDVMVWGKRSPDEVVVNHIRFNNLDLRLPFGCFLAVILVGSVQQIGQLTGRFRFR